MDVIFGLDFGTTNSLASLVQDDQVLPFLDRNEAHPSVVWYRGPGNIVVGREAKENLGSRRSGVIGDFVRSPKSHLGKGRPIYVAGRTLPASDVTAEIFKFLRNHVIGEVAKRNMKGIDFERAVVTIPITMHGLARQELRDAAHKAGLRIHQFVHEPLAALYGYLRSQPDFKRRCAELENRAALVVDWGGGTLDLTLCKFMRGALVQIGNQGDGEVGGDRFDEAIADHIRNKHCERYSLDSGREDTELATAKLIEHCELAKKQLSTTSSATVFVQDFFKSTGPERTLQEKLTREELIDINAKLIADGLKNIDKLLETTDYGRPTVAFCLATGGMRQMPFIRDRLRQIFSFDRVKAAEHPERLIAEGAAWIAHDSLALELAKPFELYHADNTYVPVLPPDFRLPIENKQSRPVSLQVYCVDPRDGFAKLQFVRPAWPGRSLPSDPRQIYTTQILKVDPNAAPFVERIMLDINIDHNLVVRVRARSGEDDKVVEIHDLEFGLDLRAMSGDGSVDGTSGGSSASDEPPTASANQTAGSVRLRSNVFLHSHCIDGDPYWDVVPDEIVEQHSPSYLRIPLNSRQIAEKMYYEPCSLCHRGIYEIMLKGCDVRQCPESRRAGGRRESSASASLPSHKSPAG